MNLLRQVSSVLPLLVIILLGFSCEAFTPADHYILSCGSSTSPSVNAFDGRVWSSDENHTFSSSFISTIAVSANQHPVAPFTAARIFNSSFTYTFPVSRPGPIFLRLYFYPALYSDQFDASQFFVSVQANGHLLLRNFSAQLAINYALCDGGTIDQFILKEYYLTIPNTKSNNFLKLTFAPTPPSSYAFVNGIEVVSVPEGLYLTDNDDVKVKNVQFPANAFEIPITYALETAYRLNVGGGEVSVETDGNATSMYRLWKKDDPYTFLFSGWPGLTRHPISYTKKVPNYTAPEPVYQSFRELGFGKNDPDFGKRHNLTWRFKVDPGFYYMLRLHWCEVVSDINNVNELLFDVYINNLTAESQMDVMEWTANEKYVPIYKDYAVYVAGGDGGGGSGEIWLTLQPSILYSQVYIDVLLNGLEIFKISRIDRGLDAPNPNVPLASKNHGKENPNEPPNRSHLLPAIIGGILLGIVLTSLACLLIFRGKKWDLLERSRSHSIIKMWLLSSYRFGRKASSTSSSPQPNLCYRFSLSQIKSATDNFSDTFIIGTGGFGIVYVATIHGVHGTMKVAIKRLKPSSKQGINEFWAEIEMLSNHRHKHLVTLIGYCEDQEEMILVYEYMKGRTLRGHLYNTDNPPLSWSQRLNVCIGAARGLHYLHAGGKNMIIHRDVKSSNILLDEGLVAKVSDFGLSKVGPTSEEFHHISTGVKGSLGYVDPEYYRRRQLTEKSDVYSFGVVLFEVLCGRPAVNPNLPKEEMNIVMWARRHQQRGNLHAIVDPKLNGQVELECLRKYGEIAERCVRNNGTERPSMFDVVQALEICSVN